ncbi:unnamed protein product, partial [Heterotrigona itama]
APKWTTSFEFDNDTLKSLVESDLRLSIQELPTNLGSSYTKLEKYI